MTVLEQQAIAAKKASRTLMTAGTTKKNDALKAIADALIKRQDEWLSANAEDMEAAEKAGISRGTVTAVKTGKSCSPQTAEKLAAVLGREIIEEARA